MVKPVPGSELGWGISDRRHTPGVTSLVLGKYEGNGSYKDSGTGGWCRTRLM